MNCEYGTTIKPTGEITPNWTMSNNTLLRVNAIRDRGLIFVFAKTLSPRIFVYHDSMK